MQKEHTGKWTVAHRDDKIGCHFSASRAGVGDVIHRDTIPILRRRQLLHVKRGLYVVFEHLISLLTG
jgi:hypothetical protein